jgi:DNA-binding MarR family transcriptional regulator
MADPRTNSELASSLRPAILRLSRRLRQMRDESLDLSASQLGAMGVLFRNGELPIGELAAQEKVQPPSMTRTVNCLAEAGMVTRTAGDTDRRQSKVKLTEAGRGVLLADRRRRDAWLTKRIAELTPEEKRVLRQAVKILEKVND